MLVARAAVDPQLPNYPYGMPCDQVLPLPSATFAAGTTQGLSQAEINTQLANQAISQSLGLGCAGCGGSCGNKGLGDGAQPSDNVFTWMGGTIGVVVALFAYDYLKKYWRPE